MFKWEYVDRNGKSKNVTLTLKYLVRPVNSIKTLKIH